MFTIVQTKNLKGCEMQEFVKKEVLKYNVQTHRILQELKKNDKKVWEGIGFFCSFKEGFFICDYNEDIALQNQDIMDDIIRK